MLEGIRKGGRGQRGVWETETVWGGGYLGAKVVFVWGLKGNRPIRSGGARKNHSGNIWGGPLTMRQEIRKEGIVNKEARSHGGKGGPKNQRF